MSLNPANGGYPQEGVRSRAAGKVTLESDTNCAVRHRSKSCIVANEIPACFGKAEEAVCHPQACDEDGDFDCGEREVRSVQPDSDQDQHKHEKVNNVEDC